MTIRCRRAFSSATAEWATRVAAARRWSTVKSLPASVSVPKLWRPAVSGSSKRSPLSGEGADLDDLAAEADDEPAGRAGRLDRGLDDHAQKLVDVMGRSERLAEADRRLAHARTLGPELLQAGLELVGHLVERRAEPSKLVATVDVDALVEASARDRIGGLRETRERADDRPADDVRDEGNQGERPEQAEEQRPVGPRHRLVDLGLWAEEHERGIARLRGFVGKHAILLRADLQRLGGLRDGHWLTTHRCRPGDNAPFLDDDELVVLQSRAEADAIECLLLERNSREQRP